jgi:aldose 1-epimerase
MSITKRKFGVLPNGQEVFCFKLLNSKGMRAEILNFGGILRSLVVPVKDNRFLDVVLGYDTIDGYLVNEENLGAAVGRLVGPVPHCLLEIGGERFKLEPSNPEGGHMHGGKKGFGRSLWNADSSSEPGSDSVILTLNSPDGDGGYPGELDARIVYSLTDDCALEIKYEAEADRDTVFNPTNHSYFNLAGHDSGHIGSQIISVFNYAASVNGAMIPVSGTPLDLNKPHAFSSKLECGHEYLSNGFDNFHLLNGDGVRLVMRACDPGSGCEVNVFTDCTAAILYSGNYLNNIKGKGGAIYGRQNGFCFETCYVSDDKKFNPSHARIVGPGKPFNSFTSYRFSVNE